MWNKYTIENSPVTPGIGYIGLHFAILNRNIMLIQHIVVKANVYTA